MRPEVIEYINSDNDLKRFLVEQPIWYRILSRNPGELEQFEIASLHYFKQTIPHKVEKFSNGIQMASMMMHMFQNMKG
ncbi:YlbE-like family protein [Bacillus chungangensis]|uniref:YlbE-like protein n=1 Tax=Bacillus chungangensis TaxID=587633 RepID=A0ABT9WY65_9BACI|nr:YlbE-like family protein [Bacillus chungangensis]MDQ0177690.1 hypothetical protein [Bacillus chungangensis]